LRDIAAMLSLSMPSLRKLICMNMHQNLISRYFGYRNLLHFDVPGSRHDSLAHNGIAILNHFIPNPVILNPVSQ